jgi:RNA polymerase sigma-70 factor (ECF subfamily)
LIVPKTAGSRSLSSEQGGTALLAIEKLYREYGDLVLRRAQRIMGNESDAQEVLQELFMSFMRDPQQLEGKQSMSAWLYSATTHLCLNTIRNRKNRARLLQLHKPVEDGAAGPQAENLLTAQQLLAQLPDDLAQVAIYYYFDELTHAEISEILGCSRRQVGNLLDRVQERIRVRQ